LQYWRYRLGYKGATETREGWIVIIDELEKKEKYKEGTNKLTQIHGHNQDELAQIRTKQQNLLTYRISICVNRRKYENIPNRSQ